MEWRFAATVTCLMVFVVGDANASSASPRTARQITKEAPAVTPTNISEACRTTRAVFGPLHNGLWKLGLIAGDFSGTSRVFVSIGEGDAAGKIIADTKFILYDVAPTSGEVDILVQVDSPGSPQASVDYLVCNP
jgi:hypothetical protein